MERCDYLLPDYFGHIAIGDDVRPQCLLPQEHEGAHLVQFSGGQHIEWEHSRECIEPEACAEYAHCQHFDYWTLTKEQAQERIDKEGPRT